jgi:tRNA1(Val) A37 N6-methylase TrmN6
MPDLATRSAATAAEAALLSEDAVLGGRLILRQPRKGHRVGHDAILLAAACSARPGDRVVELGAGVGAAGLAVARRIDDASVTLVEVDPALAKLAGVNAERNGLAARVRSVCLDVTASPSVFAAAGLGAGTADHVLMNPPFNTEQNPSPDPARRLAHVAGDDTPAVWVGAAAHLLRNDGVVTLIWRADGFPAVLAALGNDFGAVAVLPVHPKPAAPAIRVLVRAVKGARSPLTHLPGLVLADADNKPTAEAEAVLREGAVLALAR